MDRCPHIIRKQAGDETYDLCETTERPSGRIKPCLLESGSECEVWNEIKQQWQNEILEAEIDSILQDLVTEVTNRPKDEPPLLTSLRTLSKTKAIVKLISEHSD